MRDFAINILAGAFLLFVVWRLKRFGLLARMEAVYLSWERRALSFVLWLAPVAIPAVMLAVWLFVFVSYIRTNGVRFSNLFVVWTLVVWFVAPLFERGQPLYRTLSRWYENVLSPGATSATNIAGSLAEQGPPRDAKGTRA
jgi:hypothetical protein